MSDDSPRPARPSWKRAGAEPRAAEPSSHEWSRRNLPAANRAQGPRSRNFKVVGVATALAACIALILFLIFLFRPPHPAAVVLVGADYSTNLAVPHNLLGWRGLQGLEAVSRVPPRWSLFPPATLQLIKGGATPLDLATDWDALIEDLKGSARGYRTLLIAVALHGGTTAESAYLIPARSSGPNPDRLDLAHVIKSMAELPPDQNKILVLEGALVPADWRLGMLYNDFARRLEALEPEIRRVKNLWVLSGCDVDQQCWASEGLGRSAFFHYIIQALQDRTINSGGRLDLKSLHEYVRRNVRNWAWNARGAIQEPVLLPAEAAAAEAGRAGKTPSRPPVSSVHLATAEPQPSQDTPAALDQAALARQWRSFQELDRLSPHPSTYSPRRWRQYRATLIRYEELARSGATPQQLDPLAERTSSLEARIRADRYFTKLTESPQHNLVMSSVQGAIIPARRDADAEFSRLWKPPAGTDPSRAWEEIQKTFAAAEADPAQPLRCRVDDYLIQRAIADPDPSEGLAIAADRLRQQTRDSRSPQPSEAHFLIMLDGFLRPATPRPPSFWPRAARALRIRRLAERVALGIPEKDAGYGFSERLMPWLRGLVDRADEQRRLGEDQLLASDESAWDRAEQSLAASEALYRSAIAGGDRVRQAISARDLALSSLQDYARWMGHRRPEELGKDDLANAVVETYGQAHALADRLDEAGDAQDASLEKLRQGLSSGMEALGRRFRDHASNLAGDRRPADCEAAVAVAAVPFPDNPELAQRTALWDRLDAIRLHDFKLAGGGDSPQPTPADLDVATDVLRRRGRLQGRMAMAALGQAWFNAPGFQGGPTFDQVSKQIESAFEEGGDRPWWRSIAEAGDAIGLRWRSLAPRVEDLTRDEARDAEPAAAATRMTTASRLDRILDGGAEALPDPDPESATLDRRLRIRGLLLWLAERAWRDHWFDEDHRAIVPYYRAVGSRLVGDAARIRAKDPEIVRVQQMLARNDRLKIDGPPHEFMTTEPFREVAYRIGAEGAAENIPPGLPVIRPVVAAGTEADLELVDGNGGYKLAPWRTGGDVAKFAVTSRTIRSVESDESMNRPVVKTCPLVVEGFYRGQRFDSRTAFELHPVPHEISISPPTVDPRASLCVRADERLLRRFGSGNGAIAIVLDMSGSMTGLTPSGRERIAEAKTALDQLLQVIPQGTRLSLWIFSQVDVNEPNPLKSDPRVLAPENTIKRLREPKEWSLSERPGLLAELEKYRPFCETPLVQAMWHAAGNDLLAAKGLKTLLVLTDGADTRFMKNTDFNPVRDGKPTFANIADFIGKAFDKTAIQVNMVYFAPNDDEVAKKELQEAKENFEEPLRRLDRPGTFVAVKDLGQLLSSLKQGIRQDLACRVYDEHDRPISDELLPVTRVGEEDHWWLDGLDPDRLYTVSVLADRAYSHKVDLRRSEHLLIKLVDVGDRIEFQRGLYSEDFTARKSEDRSESRLSGLAGLVTPGENGDRLRTLVSLEQVAMKLPDPEPIRQAYPQAAWFRIEAESPETFTSIWRDLPTYPAPAWEIDVPNWPKDPAGQGPARPILRGWWLTAGQVQRTLPEISLEGDSSRRLRLDDGSEVVLEGLNVESHFVDVGEGRRVERRCLAIRLAYPKDQLHIVNRKSLLDAGIGTEGMEQRIFMRANRYTGLFWPVQEESASKLRRIGLLPIGELMKLAEKQQTTATVKLPAPERGGQFPPPPPPLRPDRRALQPRPGPSPAGPG
ncbi:hypothetical protein [Aquisphaera insulae]|uniref:hypothetical protein n=1 Tax=Aquisphaera insulae TaxID=2712864 RepID=UPI0013EC2FB7|nr:hypothetical protein [Aquisphaera insulae]